MANAVYPLALEAMLTGGVNVSSGNVKVALLSAGYTYDDGDEFLDDIDSGDIVAHSPNLTSKTVTGGVFDAANPTFTNLTGADVVAYVIYIDTGTAATSRLLAYFDRDPANQEYAIEPDGGDWTLEFFDLGIFRI